MRIDSTNFSNGLEKHAWRLSAAAVLFLAGCATDTPRKSPQTLADVTSPVSEGSSDPIADSLFGLSPVEREKEVGRKVELLNVRVQRVVSPDLFWVGADNAAAVPVMWKKAHLENVRSGDIVDIRGNLQRTANARTGIPKAVRASERSAFADARFYVQATAVDRSGRHLSE